MKPARASLIRSPFLLGGTGGLGLGLAVLLWLGSGLATRAPTAPVKNDQPAVAPKTAGQSPRGSWDTAHSRPTDLRSAASEDTEARRMHAALSVKDSAFAAAFAAALPPDPLQGDLLGQSVPAWAARDLAAALAWARALPDGTAKQSALLHLLPAWEKADLDGLLEFAATLPPEYSQFQAVIAGRLAGRDPEGALLWAGLLQPGRSRDQAVTNAAAIWASASPGDAAGFFAALPAGEMQQAGALVAVSAWAAQDLVAAAQWVADLRDGKLKRLAGDRLAFWEAKEAAGGISLLAGRRESKVTPPLSPAPTGSRRFPTNE